MDESRNADDCEGAMDKLKKELLQLCKNNNEKDDEIRKLRKHLMKLTNDDGSQKGQGSEWTVDRGVTETETERKDAAVILPEEVWRMIFENVSKPKDLWNLCNTCSLFDRILEPWKTKHMFKQALPYLFQHLPGNKLLESRLVCKGWNAAVDKFLRSHSSIRPPHAKRGDPRRLTYITSEQETESCHRNTFVISSAADFPILRSPDIPNRPGRNPFIGRNVVVELTAFDLRGDVDGQALEHLLREIRQFLETHGEPIWYLTIRFPKQAIHPYHVHGSMVTQFVTRDIVPLLPNLRKLDTTMTQKYCGAVHPRRARRPRTTLVPPAPKLEEIKVTNKRDSDLGIIMYTMLRGYRLQLRKLNLSITHWKIVSVFPWPCLAELHLSHIIGPYWLSSLSEALMPRLRKLGLTLNQSIRNPDLVFDVVLAAIRDVAAGSPLLDTVRLEGGLINLKAVQKVQNKRAPVGVKTLEIGHYLGGGQQRIEAPSFTFLLNYFPHIENVRLFSRSRSWYDNETEIKLCPFEVCAEMALERKFQRELEIVEVNKYVYERGMYKSNIWELLPRLNVFSFQWDVYTRDGYDNYSRQVGKLEA